MHLRSDAGYVAARIATLRARGTAQQHGGDQIATVGALTLSPNLVNVIANRALLTVDLRNTDGAVLKTAEQQLWAIACTRPSRRCRNGKLSSFHRGRTRTHALRDGIHVD